MEQKKIIFILDKLALALTCHKHKWTKEERKLYEQSIRLLKKA